MAVVDQAFIIQQILNRDILYAAFCVNTRMPFVICDPETYNDEVWIFDREDTLKKFVEEYAQKKYVIRGAKMEQKQIAGFLSSLYTLDVNEIVYAASSSNTKLPLSELAKKPDFSKIPSYQRPVENPPLQLSGLYFMQEATRQIPQSEKTNLQELNEEFSANLAGARYLVAVIPNAGPGTVQEKLRRHEYSVPVLNMKNGKKYVPCFSDQFEYDKFRRQQRLLEMAVPLPGLAQYSGKDTDGFMLNPMGMSMPLTKELIDTLQKAFPDRVQTALQKSSEIVQELQAQAKKNRETQTESGKNRNLQPHRAAGKNPSGAGREESRREIPVGHLPGHSNVLTPFSAQMVAAAKAANLQQKNRTAPAPVYRPSGSSLRQGKDSGSGMPESANQGNASGKSSGSGSPDHAQDPDV